MSDLKVIDSGEVVVGRFYKCLVPMRFTAESVPFDKLFKGDSKVKWLPVNSLVQCVKIEVSAYSNTKYAYFLHEGNYTAHLPDKEWFLESVATSDSGEVRIVKNQSLLYKGNIAVGDRFNLTVPTVFQNITDNSQLRMVEGFDEVQVYSFFSSTGSGRNDTVVLVFENENGKWFKCIMSLNNLYLSPSTNN